MVRPGAQVRARNCSGVRWWSRSGECDQGRDPNNIHAVRSSLGRRSRRNWSSFDVLCSAGACRTYSPFNRPEARSQGQARARTEYPRRGVCAGQRVFPQKTTGLSLPLGMDKGSQVQILSARPKRTGSDQQTCWSERVFGLGESRVSVQERLEDVNRSPQTLLSGRRSTPPVSTDRDPGEGVL